MGKYFSKNTRLALEHKERFYPTQASVFADYGQYKKLHGKCMRAAYYSCMGIPELEEDRKVSGLTVMKLGDYAEKMILDIMSDIGALVESGTKFEIKNYNVFGKLDAIIKVEDEEIGLEVKSIGSNKYAVNSIFGSPWNEPAPKWPHLLQTLVYCYAFRERISKFIILYIRRDTGETKEFTVSIVSEKDTLYPVIDGKIDKRYTLADLLSRYSELQSYLEKSQVPPRDFIKIYPKSIIPQYVKLGIISKKQSENYKTTPFGDFECRYCGYVNICDRDK